MYTRSVFFSAAAALAATAIAGPVSSPNLGNVFRRQENADSTCESYGIDFVSGGNYFINTNSNASFTTVSQFDGCNNDTASILLVNDSTEEEYECTSLPTVPDDVSQMSTCPISKDQMTSGEWSILVLGNNGNGNPFAYERDFTLTCGPQQTTTVTPTITYTSTVIPITTVTSTSIVDTTTTLPATSTVTVPAKTRYTTVTPKRVTTTSTKTLTHTIHRWTKSLDKVTHVVTPSCTVPARPAYVDPPCHIIPTLIPLPKGIHIQKRADRVLDPEIVAARFARVRARRAAANTDAANALEARKIQARAADAPTLTVTYSIVANATTTVTAATSTYPTVVIATSTFSPTLPPSTVHKGTAVDTVTAPTPTKVIHKIAYTTTYSTKTDVITWTYTTTTTPAALATSCKKEGGHFGFGW